MSSSPHKSWNAPSLPGPLLYRWCIGRRQHWHRRGHQEQRPWWNWGHDWGIHSASLQGSEGSSAGGETLLPLQQPGAFYLWLPTGEGIQNWSTFNWKEGMVCQRRESGPLPERQPCYRHPKMGCQGIGHHVQTPSWIPITSTNGMGPKM